MKILGLTTLAAVVLTSLGTVGCEAKGETMNVPIRDSGTRDDSGPGRTDGGMTNGQCPSGPCGLLTNGCPEGEACYWTAENETDPSRPSCYPEGAQVLGEEGCDDINDCKAGLFCLLGSSGTGRCVEYCCGGQSSTCDPGTQCVVQLTDSSSTGSNAYYCEETADCSPVGQTGCSGGTSCYLTSAPMPGRICVTSGTKVEGATCVGGTECAPGHQCFAASGGTFRCYKFCDSADDCGGGSRQCTGLGYTHDADLTSLGRCTPLPS